MELLGRRVGHKSSLDIRQPKSPRKELRNAVLINKYRTAARFVVADNRYWTTKRMKPL